MKKIIAAAIALLSAAPSFAGWKTEFTVEDRVRAEMKEDFDFKAAAPDDGWNIYQRLRLAGKASRDNYEIYAEAHDLRVASVEIPKAAQGDDLDLHQAYFSARDLFGTPLSLKAGRQELRYGKGRLIWAAPWANRVNHEDAIVARYKSGPVTADAFYGARVSWDNNGWNEPNRRDIIGGVYATFQKSKDAPLFDAYFIANYDSAGMSALNRRTVGARAAFTLPGGVAVDAELPYQFGADARKEVAAHAFHLDLAKELPLAWKPRLAAAYNYATGDKNSADSNNNSFKPLYQATHSPYGVMDLFRWQNMREFAFEVSAKPAGQVKLTAGTNLFWLANTHDYWYNSSGAKVRSAISAAAGSYVGREVSFLAECDLGGGLMAEGGYAHFYSGDYVKDTGRATGSVDDASWAYLQLNLKL